jgi:TPP-dependent pyruvate/acetoin dehydrogenase alpha subunit
MAISAGAGLSSLLLENERVVVCMVGDGAVNNGICLESMNFAAMPQFGRGFPVIFVFENNQYGMSGQQLGEITALRHLAQRGAGINERNMHARVESGMHVLAVRGAVKDAVEIARNGEGPIVLEFKTYRYKGHSLSDKRMTYRTAEEEEEWIKYDPIDLFSGELVDNGVLSGDDIAGIKDRIDNTMGEITIRAAKATDPDPKSICEGLFSSTTSEGIGDTYKTVSKRFTGTNTVQACGYRGIDGGNGT